MAARAGSRLDCVCAASSSSQHTVFHRDISSVCASVHRRMLAVCPLCLNLPQFPTPPSTSQHHLLQESAPILMNLILHECVEKRYRNRQESAPIVMSLILHECVEKRCRNRFSKSSVFSIGAFRFLMAHFFIRIIESKICEKSTVLSCPQ